MKNSNNTLVSVIVPCWNVADYLQATLDSALAQSYRPIEIILVDNNSNDKTWQIIAEYREKYPNLVTAYRERKQGAPAARNKGLMAAKGDWIQFLAADDVVKARKSEHQVRVIEKSHVDVKLVASAYLISYQNGQQENFDVSQNPWLGLVNGQLGITTSNLWHRQTIMEAGGWREGQKSSQEYELMFRILEKTDAILLDKTPMCIIRRRHNSISTKTPHANRETAARLHLRMYEYLQERHPDTIESLETEFNHAVLKRLSILALSDFQIAQKYCKDWISPDFKISDISFGRFYMFFFNTFGFRFVQTVFKPYLRCKELFF